MYSALAMIILEIATKKCIVNGHRLYSKIKFKIETLLMDEQTKDFLSAKLSRASSSAGGILDDTWVSLTIPSKCLGVHEIIHILPQFYEERLSY